MRVLSLVNDALMMRGALFGIEMTPLYDKYRDVNDAVMYAPFDALLSFVLYANNCRTKKHAVLKRFASYYCIASYSIAKRL